MSTAGVESQDSVDAESSEYDEDEYDDYYTNVDDDEGMASDKEEDPESFEFEIIDSNEAQQIFDSLVAKISLGIKVSNAMRADLCPVSSIDHLKIILNSLLLIDYCFTTGSYLHVLRDF